VNGHSFVHSVDTACINRATLNLRMFFVTQIHIRASTRVVQDWQTPTAVQRLTGGFPFSFGDSRARFVGGSSPVREHLFTKHLIPSGFSLNVDSNFFMTTKESTNSEAGGNSSFQSSCFYGQSGDGRDFLTNG